MKKDIKLKNLPTWVQLALAILMIILGVIMLFNPLGTIISISILCGIIFIVKGITEVFAYIKTRNNIWILAMGILDIVFGFIFLNSRSIAVVTLPTIFAFWFLFNGVIEIIKSIEFKNSDGKWYVSLIWGIISIMFAIFALCKPTVIFVTIETAVGIMFVIYGLVFVIKYFTNDKS